MEKSIVVNKQNNESKLSFFLIWCKSKGVYFLISILVIFLFKNFFEDLSIKYIIEPIVSKIGFADKNSWMTDLLVILLFIILFIFNWLSQSKIRTPSFSRITIISLILSIYFYYRFIDISQTYSFYYFSFIEIIKYLDVLLFVFIIDYIILLKWIFTSKIIKNKDSNYGFIDCKPLESPVQDTLGRNPYAKKVAQKILDTENSKNSFAIGISGFWGSGKTSFLYLIKEEIKEKIKNENENSIELIEFYPWYSDSENTIVQDFFLTLNNHLKKYNPNISTNLIQYSKSLVEITDNQFSKLASKIIDIKSNLSLREQYNRISKQIKSIEKQIVIFIDDLDRLDKNEIIEVIRLIRNTANFPNTIFVVCYDKGYIIEAIKEISNYEPELYLEKIFQTELILPQSEYENVSNNLINKLKFSLTNNDYIALVEIIYPQNIFEHDIFKIQCYLPNNRNVIRFVNAFLLNYEMMTNFQNIKANEYVFSDFFYIELLRYKYPVIYEYFINNLDRFVESKSNYLTLKENSEYQVTIENFGKTLIKYKLSDTDIKKIYDLLNKLFIKNKIKNKFDISYKKYFYNYVSIRYTTNKLSQNEFDYAINISLNNSTLLNEFISEWISRNLTHDIEILFGFCINFKSFEEYKIVIEGILYFMYKSQKNIQVRINEEISIGQIIYHYKIETFVSQFTSYSNHKETNIFLKSLFQKMTYDQILVTKILESFKELIISIPNAIYPLNIDDIYDIKVVFFEKNLNNVTSYSGVNWAEYDQFKIKLKGKPEDYYLRAKDVLRNKIESEWFDDFIKNCVIITITSEIRQISANMKNIFKVYNNIQDLIDSIDSKGDSYKYEEEIKYLQSRISTHTK